MSQSKVHLNVRAIGVWLGATLAVSGAVQAQSTNNITRTSAFEYDSSGMLVKEIVEPGSSNLCVATVYTLNSFGQRLTDTTRNCNGSTANESAAPAGGSAAIFTARTGSTGYSSDGRFAISSNNALSQSESRTYDPTLGVMTSQTGPNGLTTSWAYDGFGRKVLERRADGNGVRWKYEYCTSISGGTATCPTVGAAVTNGAVVTGSVPVTPVYVVTTIPVKSAVITLTVISALDKLYSSTDGGDGGASGPYVKTYYDTLGRVIRTETLGFDGNTDGTTSKTTAPVVYQDISYDSLGHMLANSRPYYQGASTIYWATYTYDKLDRVLSETAPDENKPSTGRVITTAYQGLITVVTNDRGKTIKEARNVAGLVVTITDSYNKTLTKTHDATGNLLTTTDAAGNLVSLTYDLKGRKTAMKDPDMGSWTYVYDALGQLVSQTDAKSQVTTMAYDLLGRLTQKSEPSIVSNWYYDKYQDGSTCATGTGKLCEVSSNNGYGRKHVYDSLGRPSSTTSTIGTAYTSSTTYRPDGRVDTVSYPSGKLIIKNSYTTLGYLQQVTSGASTYWQALATDAEGHLLQEKKGNNVSTTYGFSPQSGRLKSISTGNGTLQDLTYAYDTLGNLTSFTDKAIGAGPTYTTATYTYDDINRLTSEVRIGSGVASPGQTISWTYDTAGIGNIATRTEGGSTLTYAYPPGGAASVRPHAVSGITGTVNGVASPSYGYDANGNLTSATGRTVTWTSFNKVNTITQTGSNTNVLGYTYDAEGERVKETYTKNGTLQRTTVYLNPGAGAGLFYEEEITPTVTKQKHYLSAAGGAFAVLTWDKTNSVWLDTQYWHKDNLGSTTVVTGSAGGQVERMAYEPFGKRRNVDETNDLLGTLAATSTRRGFTGHEMIDEVGLVNMNGRIYDPAISRFLSADPYIQAPGNPQSYNRYSYAWNSPLNGTDPSGYNVFNRINRALRVVDGRDAADTIRQGTMKVVFDLNRQLPGTKQIDNFVMNNQWAYQIGMAVASYYGGAAGAAAYTSYYTYVATGSISQADRAGQIAFAEAVAFNIAGNIGATYGPVAHYAAHAVVGCLSASAHGGGCGQGAISQMVSLGITDATKGASFGFQYVSAIAAGGITSKLMGGSFSTGASTAAFGYLFNQALHCGCDTNRRAALALDRFISDFFNAPSQLIDSVFRADEADAAVKGLTDGLANETDQKGRPMKGHYVKPGGSAQADLDALPGTTGSNGQKTLPDGSTAGTHTSSTTGHDTLHINRPEGKRDIKIRYPES